MTQSAQDKLLTSMQADRLVIIAGAGLSMAAPSSLPPAWLVSNAAFDKYMLDCGGPPPASVNRDDLESVAEFFATEGILETVFIKNYVPWGDFVKPANAGHSAIADFLVCGAISSALSANYDVLVEDEARRYGSDFMASLNGGEANVHSSNHNPYLKFHGCSTRSRSETIWTKSQLTIPRIATTIGSCSTWMASNLKEKDLLIIGFWSDWGYLNEIIGEAIKNVNPSSITVVDPCDLAKLEEKAPSLWALAHKEGVRFAHVQESGADFLDKLRKSFSLGYMRKVVNSGAASFEAQSGDKFDPAWLDFPALSSSELYDFRRDSEGVPSDRPAKLKAPNHTEALGLFHILMRRAGAVLTNFGYNFKGKNIRVVNGAGAVLGTIKKAFISPPSLKSKVDITVCVGAIDVPAPPQIIEKGRANDIMRPQSQETWIDYNTACKELGV